MRTHQTPSLEASSPGEPAAPASWLDLVREHVAGLRYGVVQLVVHDGRVTQIERTEKTRVAIGETSPKPGQA